MRQTSEERRAMIAKWQDSDNEEKPVQSPKPEAEQVPN